VDRAPPPRRSRYLPGEGELPLRTQAAQVNRPNSLRCLNGAVRAAGGNAVRPRWYRPRHLRGRCQAPTAGTVRTPGTSGISAWLLRSEARRNRWCRGERTGQDRRRDKRRGHASPAPRRRAAVGEIHGLCHSWATPPFLLVGPRRDSGLVVPSLPRISRGRAPGITADAYLCPRLPVLAEPLLAATTAVVAGARRLPAPGAW
jgi:hypothetical protein